MNGLGIVVLAMLVFALAYRFYGAFLAAKVAMLDPTRVTPAVRFRDGQNYHPTNKWVVFGHHFAAIAGAGPLVGPVLAAQFGYLPGLLWILIGAVLGGAVHDFIILVGSVRSDGKSLAQIAKDHISPFSGAIAMVAILFIVVTALAGLALVVVNALADSPWGAFTILLTIPIAIVVGLYMEHWRKGRVGEASLIGVILVLGAVVIGGWVHHSDLAEWFRFNRAELSIAVAVYGFVASVLPVWLLLAPRDYLSSYMKIGTVALLAIGILFVAPEIRMPAISGYAHGGGPIIPGAVWPFVCITVACGAISGFHALIASGTTPKMLANEKEALFVGYGAMLAEGFVAVMALVAATVLLPGDYFAINVDPKKWAAFGIEPVELGEFCRLVNEDLAGRTGGAVTLAIGMAHIFSSIPGMRELMAYWYHFAIMFEALFILTTVDAGTRVGRYLLQEAFGRVYPPLGRFSWMPSVLITSALFTFAWGYLLYYNDVSSIWPMFGVANQLLAVIAFTVGTIYLLHTARRRLYCLTTAIPGIILVITTVTAAVLNIVNNFLPRKDANGYLNAVLTTVMIACVIAIIVDGAKAARRALSPSTLASQSARSEGGYLKEPARQP